MDRLLPVLAGLDRPGPGGAAAIHLRSEVWRAGSERNRVRALPGAAEMADPDAHPRPAGPGRPAEPHRLSGGHRVRLRGAAAQPAPESSERLRHAVNHARHVRGDAARLADVLSAL